MDKEQVGYGLWKSSITPQTLAGYIRLNEVQWDSDGETLVWSEGRGDLVAQTGAQGPHELLGSGIRASGGLGSFAVQLCATAGAHAIGVVSEDDKIDFVKQLGAKGVINRKKFNCWGQLPKVNSPEFNDFMKEARKFGKAIWDITGKGVNVDCVFEHPGEATIPVSVQVVKRGGMVVICAGTSGYNLTMDARYLWMHQKRVQGSHFANLKQAAAANKLVVERRIDPKDRRARHLILTPAGAVAMQNVDVIASRLRHELLDGLDDSALHQLQFAIDRILDNAGRLMTKPRHSATEGSSS